MQLQKEAHAADFANVYPGIKVNGQRGLIYSMYLLLTRDLLSIVKHYITRATLYSNRMGPRRIGLAILSN